MFWLECTRSQNEQFKNYYEKGDVDAVEKIAKEMRANFIAAVITYQKYFTKCHGISITPLKPTKIYTVDQLDIHNRIDELRNKLLAHIDHSDLFTHKLYALTDPKGEFAPSIQPTYLRTNHFVDEMLEGFIELTKFLIVEQNDSYAKSGQALMDKEFGGK